MKTNECPYSYYNKLGKRVLEICSNYIKLDLPIVLTTNKELILGYPYILLESNKSIAIRLLDLLYDDSIVLLNVQDIATHRVFNLSWNMDYTGSFWLWCLADLENINNSLK